VPHASSSTSRRAGSEDPSLSPEANRLLTDEPRAAIGADGIDVPNGTRRPTGRLGRYGKRADLIVHQQEPFNAETGLAALAEGPLTATDAFYVRGHGSVPEIDPATWRLHLHGLVERELDLSLTTLREAFREREVTATLQCAGNRRAGLIAIRDIPGEAPWGPGATGTATWSGVALADVLAPSASVARSRWTRRAALRFCSPGR
jgi:DMSO/TMAO reductase YedYZ molybdopterin-dependent catalytic subunit